MRPHVAGRVVVLAAVVAAALPATASASPFHVPPDPLPPGGPGDVIRSAPVRLAALPGVRAWRVLYRSTTATGEETAVSGIVAVPPRRRAAGGSLVGVAPGFPGMDDRCAPSRTMPREPSSETPLVGLLLARGHAVALTDYEGLGTPGEHRYVVGASEAHAMLDVLRAARRLPEAGIDPAGPAVVTGYSQGGHAAMFTAELQPSYAPDVPLRGVAAGGLPADFEAIARFLDGGWFSQLFSAVALAYEAAYPEIELDDVLTPRGRSAVDEARRDCIEQLLTSRHSFSRLARLTTRNPLADPVWLGRFRENRAAQRRPPMPLLLYHSRADQGLPFAQAQAARDRYCALGATVRWHADVGTEHARGFLRPLPRTVRWLDERLRGLPPENGCPGAEVASGRSVAAPPRPTGGGRPDAARAGRGDRHGRRSGPASGRGAHVTTGRHGGSSP